MPRSTQNPSRAQPRQFSSPNNNAPDNDMDVRPEWNGTQLKLVAHLKACAQWMPQQQQGFDLFMEKGVIINSRQQVVLYGPEHLRAYIASSTLLGTFEDPSPRRAARQLPASCLLWPVQLRAVQGSSGQLRAAQGSSARCQGAQAGAWPPLRAPTKASPCGRPMAAAEWSTSCRQRRRCMM